MEGENGNHRFATVSHEKKKKILGEKNAKSTLKAGRISMNVLQKYCTEKGIPFNPITIPAVQLNDILTNFYVEVRKEDGTFYKKTSFVSLRHGLQREFDRLRGIDDIDILEGDEFKTSSEMFTAQCVQQKKMGLAKVDHTPQISEADIKLLYSSGVLSIDSPKTLQNKVFFEVVLYFCRRGLEGLRQLTKDSFVVKTEENGRRYVVSAKDEWEKNHGVNDPNKEGGVCVMMQRIDANCPVKSFLLYMEKCNPARDEFFQRPKDNVPSTGPWYDNQVIGVKTIEKWMKRLSAHAKLSMLYTNHSIRSTCITMLDAAGFEARHIMAISGHRSEASIRSYAKTSMSTKRKISDHLSAIIAKKPTPCFDFGLNFLEEQDEDDENDNKPDPPSKQTGTERQIDFTIDRPGPSVFSRPNNNLGQFSFTGCNVTIHNYEHVTKTVVKKRRKMVIYDSSQ